MPNKRQELKKPAKGKGLNVLKDNSTLEEELDNKGQVKESKESVVGPSNIKNEEKVKNAEKEEATIDMNPKILEIQPSPEEEKDIQSLCVGEAEYALVWRVFASTDDKRKIAFNKNERITFNIDCTVAKIISQLQGSFSLEVISFDTKSHHSQALYSFKIEDKIKYENFRVQFSTDAYLQGVFELQVLFIIDNTEYFHINRENYFRIM